MRFTVYKKGVLDYLAITIVNNLGALLAIIITALDGQKEAIFLMYFFIVAIIVLNITLFTRYQILLSSVIFEETAVRCTFLKRTRRFITYDDIKDYGVFWTRGTKFIYISNMVLTQFQREETAFKLYMNTKNVVVLQYQDKVMDYLDIIKGSKTSDNTVQSEESQINH